MPLLTRTDSAVPAEGTVRGGEHTTAGCSMSRRNQELLGYYAQVWALALLLADQNGPYRDGFEQMLQDAANGGFRRKVMNHPAVISRGGRGRNAHLGRWAAIAYFGDLEELKAAYKEKIRDLTS